MNYESIDQSFILPYHYIIILILLGELLMAMQQFSIIFFIPHHVETIR